MKRYPISPKSFKKAIEHFCEKHAMTAYFEQLSYCNPSWPQWFETWEREPEKVKLQFLTSGKILFERYHKNPKKHRSDDIFAIDMSTDRYMKGMPMSFQLTYSFEQEDTSLFLRFKLFINRYYCKKRRITRWSIPIIDEQTGTLNKKKSKFI